MLLRGTAGIHPLLGFLSILGGVLAFGVFGFLIGPVVLSLVLSAIRIYRSTCCAPGLQVRPRRLTWRWPACLHPKSSQSLSRAWRILPRLPPGPAVLPSLAVAVPIELRLRQGTRRVETHGTGHAACAKRRHSSGSA